MATVLLSVCLFIRTKCLLPWTILGFSPTLTVGEMVNSILQNDVEGLNIGMDISATNIQVSRVMVSKSKTGDFENIFNCVRIGDVLELFGRYFRIEIHETISVNNGNVGVAVNESPKLNAFSILMENRQKLTLPSKKHVTNNKKEELFNSFIDWLTEMELGFMPEYSDTTGKLFIQTMVSCLWYIDPHVQALESRSCDIPPTLQRFMGFNCPEASKHSIQPLQCSKLIEHASNLDKIIEMPFLKGQRWHMLSSIVTRLSDSIHKYCLYLQKQREKVSFNRESEAPVRSASEAENLTFINAQISIKPYLVTRYKELTEALNSAQYNQPLDLDRFTPTNTLERRYYLKTVPQAMQTKIFMYTYAYGNNLGTYHFIWKTDPFMSEEELVSSNTKITSKIKEDMPKYHTRKMRKIFVETCGRFCNMENSYLRSIYQRLTGDSSLAVETSKDVVERINYAFSIEDPDIITDLRKLNEGRPSEYSVFFEHCKTYLTNVVEEVCDDRRHDKLTYLAKAISVPDLQREVAKMCPDAAIPSVQWIRYQFAPKNPHQLSSLKYTGKLNIKFMVQSRIFRKQHEDDHYCAALFRYLREMCIVHRDIVNFICMDDKHFCKVGEPGNPIAAIDRGKRVLVSGDKLFAASDHDFAKISVVPSVTFLIDVPDSIDGSFYRGQVFVGLKDHVFQSSSPLRHMTELKEILSSENQYIKPLLFIHTDGGPDHRVNFLSVKASLICIFRALDLDMLVAVRTAPNASWRNPPERIMSILNLALNCVGLMRDEMDEQNETLIKSCNSMNSIRERAQKHPGLKEAVNGSLESVKELMNGLFSRLYLKEKPFKVFEAATDSDMSDLWREIQAIDSSILDDEQSASQLKKKKDLLKFMEHCCTSKHYSFVVKKCGSYSCDICLPPRLPKTEFETLHAFPDPTPDTNGQYFKFNDVYGKVETNESHRPSFKEEKKKTSPTNFPNHFTTSAQTAKTVQKTVTCSVCGKPRVIHSKSKLTINEQNILERFLQFYAYTCGSDIQQLINDNSAPQVSSLLKKLYVRNSNCGADVETSYYSSKVFTDVCVKCVANENLNKEKGKFPMCQNCSQKCQAPLSDNRRKRARKM